MSWGEGFGGVGGGLGRLGRFWWGLCDGEVLGGCDSWFGGGGAMGGMGGK